MSAGWAIASPAEDALLGDLADPAHRGRAFGVKEAAAGLGAALGPLAGGAMYDFVDPAMAFVLNGTLLLVTGLLVWFCFVRGYPAPPARAEPGRAGSAAEPPG